MNDTRSDTSRTVEPWPFPHNGGEANPWVGYARTLASERDRLAAHNEALQKSIDYLQPLVDLIQNGGRADSRSLIRAVENAKADRKRAELAESHRERLEAGLRRIIRHGRERGEGWCVDVARQTLSPTEGTEDA